VRTAILIAASAVLLFVGWFVWGIYDKKTTSNPWNVVSSKALVVIESSDFGSLQRKLKEHAGIANIKAVEKDIALLPSVFFNKRELLLAFYFDNETIEGLIVIPHQSSKALLDFEQKGIHIQTRKFNGYDIADLYEKKKHVASCIIIDDLLVLGAPFLVEDAIRIYSTKEGELFEGKYKPLFKLKTLKTDDGNVYINVPALLRVNNEKGNKSLFNKVTPAILADLKMDKDQIFLNGFAMDSLQESTLFSLFKNQQPGSFSMKEIVSVRSAFVTHYSLSDPVKWFLKRNQFMDPAIKEELSKIEKELGVDFERVQKSIVSEVAVCSVEGLTNTFDKVFIVKTKDNSIDNAVTKLQRGEERYSSYTIHELRQASLAKGLLWPIVTTDEFTFSSRLNDYVLFSTSSEVIKEFLSDYDSENTLSKSLEWNKFLSTSMQESSINLFFTGSGMNQIAKEYGLRFFEALDFENIDKAAVQFSALDEYFYANAILSLKESKETKRVTSGASSLKFNGVVTSLPSMVLNHTDKTNEIFLQDSLHTIYLISPENQLLWSLDLDGEIRGDVEQIDFYKNRKLQYFFTTRDNLHLIDRLGRNVNGFRKPVKLNQDEILFSRVVDYDNTRNYRFMVVSKKGNVYIYDQSGNGLEGWSPKAIPGIILEANHYRIAGKDYFLFVQENGLVYLYQRSGGIVKNFPVRLNNKVNGCFFVRGKDQASSYFSILTEEGLLIRIDLAGKVIAKEPLLRNYAQSRYHMVISDRDDQHLISRVDKTKIAIFDKDGKMAFEKENPASEQLRFKLFSGKKSVLAVFDPSQDLLFLMNSDGKDILAQPIESTQFPAIEFLSKDKIKIHYIFRNQLHSMTLSI